MRKFVDSMYLDLATLSLDSSGDAAPVEYTEAAIKTQTRCMELCDTTYHFKLFPNAANILDFIRGSIKFNNSQQMLHGIKQFEKFVNNNSKNNNSDGKPGNHCIMSIVKCTNNFNSLQRQNVFTPIDYEYCDIKFNVLIYDNETNQAMIGEVQFVLSWMLDAKRMCHKFKPIENQTNYISKVYDRVLQDREFRRAIERIIIECDYDSLVKYMLFFENKLLSMLNYNRPLLYECVKQKFYKGFYFFRHCIKHFSQLLGPLTSYEISRMPRRKTIDIFGFDNEQVPSLSQQLDSDFETEYFSCNISRTMDPKRGLLVKFYCSPCIFVLFCFAILYCL